MLKQHVALWRALNAEVVRRNKPFPPAQQIIPCITSVWNCTKGGVDVYSRSLKNVQALHEKLDAQAAVFLRFLKSLLYNAFQTSRCLAGYALLNYPAIQDYTTLKSRIYAEAEDFSTFL